MKKGTFITIEGGEGAGKTTMIARLAEKLYRAGYKTESTREPGGIPIAEAIRKILLNRDNTAMDPRTEALLYAAARRQHLVQKVMPALEEGAIVLCDRFIDSSLAYQGYARGLGIDEVWSINEFAVAGRLPDLTLYMDLDPELGLSRIDAAAGREINRLDLEGLAFHRKVREGYRLVAERFPERVVTLDASGDPAEVAEAAFARIMEKIR